MLGACPGVSGLATLRCMRLMAKHKQRQRPKGHAGHVWELLAGRLLVSSSRKRETRVPQLAVRSCSAMADQTAPGHCEIDVWSFNLRTETANEEDPQNVWSKRREGISALIAKYKPAVVCVQEATMSMLRDVCLHLDGNYEWKATSRFPDKQDEAAGFLLDTHRVRLLDYSVFWLSPPGCPEGKPGWDAQFPRTCEALLLEILGSGGSQVRILNTHFDHQGSVARLKSALMISESIAKFSISMSACAQILCGDFNSPKSSEAYDILVRNRHEAIPAARPMKDVFRCDNVEVSEGVRSTIHKWQGVAFTDACGDGTVDLSHGTRHDSRHIDWILFQDALHSNGSTRLRPLRCKVITDTMASGRYPSDHFPVSTTFLVEATHASSTSPAERSRL